MNRIRETQNFTDAIALCDEWHRSGMRYIELRLKYEKDTIPLHDLARTLSPDDRFAVDLLPIGDDGLRPDVHGYVFKNAKEDDHQFYLGDIDPSDLVDITEILRSIRGLIDFQLTECISTEARGRPEYKNRIRKDEKPA